MGAATSAQWCWRGMRDECLELLIVYKTKGTPNSYVMIEICSGFRFF